MTYIFMKIVQSLIFPPGIFVVFLFLASLFVKRFRGFFLFLTLLSYLLSTQFIGNILLKPLENPYNNPLKIDKDVKLIVVLGGGYYQGSANLPLSQSAFKRAVYGYKLSKKLNIPLLYNGSFYESQNAKITYQELFDDTNNIYYKDVALDTKGNALQTKEFLKEQNLLNSKIYLVTSAFHEKRAITEFKKAGIKALPAPTDFRTSKSVCFCFFFPSTDGLELSYLALHEYLALLKEKLTQPSL